MGITGNMGMNTERNEVRWQSGMPENYLARLNQLIAKEFPGFFGGREPSYRYWQHGRTRYCYNTESETGAKKPWACWNEVLTKAGKNRWRARRSKVSHFAKRKTAKSHAHKRYLAARERGSTGVKEN